MKSMILGCVATVAMASVAQAAPAVPGLAVAEAAVRDRLTDPDSAEFKWGPTPVKAGAPGVLLFCGRVNARNRMGGYIGYEWFEFALKDGAVVDLQIDAPGDEGVLTAQSTCAMWGFSS